MDDAWDVIEKITGELDARSTLPPDTEKLLRIMKLTEEAGEVTQAVIGALGQNPRKVFDGHLARVAGRPLQPGTR
jgi:hypothetical protein